MRFIALGACFLIVNGITIADPFTVGDVFVSGGGGALVYSQTGVLEQFLNPTTGAFQTGGGAFDSQGNYYLTGFDVNTVSKFDHNGNLVNAHFASGFDSNPESIVFDNSEHMFVGQHGGSHRILKFNATTGGAPIASFSPQVQNGGTDWIDLSADGHTMYYTSQGNQIKRFDIASNTQLPDFADNLPGPFDFALRILMDGSVLVADADRVLHFDSNGNLIRTYVLPGGNALFALNLDPDGTSFWLGNFSPFDIWKVDIATGNVLENFSSGPVGGLTVFANPVPEPSSFMLLATVAVLISWKLKHRRA